MMNRDADKTVRDVRRATRLKFSTEATIMIAPEGLRCEATIGEPCGNDPLAWYAASRAGAVRHMKT